MKVPVDLQVLRNTVSALKGARDIVRDIADSPYGVARDQRQLRRLNAQIAENQKIIDEALDSIGDTNATPT